jgi:hypothetical protein
MEERPTSPVGPNLPVLSATSLSHPEMVGLTTNAEVRHTESGVGVSTLYAGVHAVPVSSDVTLGRTGNAIVVNQNLNVTLSATPLSLYVVVESALDVGMINVTDQPLEPNLSVLPAASQPSVELADNAVVYTEATSPLVQMLCQASLNGSGRNDAAQAKKKAKN